MLTRELAIAAYENNRVLPDRLTRRSHAHYAAYAEKMVQLYRTGIGRTRQELHRAVHQIFARESDCPIRRVDAFCKLLDDVSTYSQDHAGQAAALRRDIFRRAAALHPLVRCPDRLSPNEETKAKAAIALEFGRTWDEIDPLLFADIPDCQRLEAFDGYASADALLARYNVAQVQVALFRAVEMVVWAHDDFKTILQYAKLAGLMHAIRRLGDGRYEMRFDGPASVLRRTRRYGVALARFLPALIACRGWRMHALLQVRRGWLMALDLSPEDRLNSHLPPPKEFDSRLEETFARRWGEKRDGWSLEREAEVLHQGQKVFVPDFVFRHDDGRRVLMEIVGFWTPEYLQAKIQTLRTFQDQHILVSAAKPAHRHALDLPPGTIYFKGSLQPSAVLERLKELAP